MVCGNCGTELKGGIKFCTKCGNKTLTQNGNRLGIVSIALILIGSLLPFITRLLGIWSMIFWVGPPVLFSGGIIIAFFSLYKEKNKVTFIGGIIAVALNALLSLLQMLRLFF